jgi:hypothetical protein
MLSHKLLALLTPFLEFGLILIKSKLVYLTCREDLATSLASFGVERHQTAPHFAIPAPLARPSWIWLTGDTLGRTPLTLELVVSAIHWQK